MFWCFLDSFFTAVFIISCRIIYNFLFILAFPEIDFYTLDLNNRELWEITFLNFELRSLPMAFLRRKLGTRTWKLINSRSHFLILWTSVLTFFPIHLPKRSFLPFFSFSSRFVSICVGQYFSLLLMMTG